MRDSKQKDQFIKDQNVNHGQMGIKPAIVWTAIEQFTQILPWAGMVGIVDSKGKIHHFAGSRKVTIVNEKFGPVMKAVLLDMDK